MSNNIQNLIPFNKRSETELREISKKGGINSGKSRREKIAVKERLSIALEMMSNSAIEKSNNEEEKLLISEVGLECYTIIKLLFSDKSSPELKFRIIEEIWNRTDGKPTIDKNGMKELKQTPIVINVNAASTAHN